MELLLKCSMYGLLMGTFLAMVSCGGNDSSGHESGPARLLPESPPEWRQVDDISWRVSSWGLRRMTTGGMLLEQATAEQRQAAGVGDREGVD